MGQLASVVDTQERWVLLRMHEGSCWVSGSLVVRHGSGEMSETLMLAAASMADRRPAPSAADFAALGRLVERRIHSLGESAPALLRLQLLKLLERAASAPGGGANDWLASYETVLSYYEPAAAYYVRRSAYQALYEANSSGPDADTLAWEYLRNPPAGECETNVNCRLDQVLESVAEYWRVFPRGSHLAQAVSRGASTLSFALEYACEATGGTRAAVDPQRLDAIESSLAEVTEQEGEAVLVQVAALREKCGGQ